MNVTLATQGMIIDIGIGKNKLTFICFLLSYFLILSDPQSSTSEKKMQPSPVCRNWTNWGYGKTSQESLCPQESIDNENLDDKTEVCYYILTSLYFCSACIPFIGKIWIDQNGLENRKSNFVYITNIHGRPTTHNHKLFKFNEGSFRQITTLRFQLFCSFSDF